MIHAFTKHRQTAFHVDSYRFLFRVDPPFLLVIIPGWPVSTAATNMLGDTDAMGIHNSVLSVCGNNALSAPCLFGFGEVLNLD